MANLFVAPNIILLGEAVASALHGLTHSASITQHALVSALC